MYKSEKLYKIPLLDNGTISNSSPQQLGTGLLWENQADRIFYTDIPLSRGVRFPEPPINLDDKM